MRGSQYPNLSSRTKRYHSVATALGLLKVKACSDSLFKSEPCEPHVNGHVQSHHKALV